MSNKVYIVYDGRAAYDEEDACILEYIGEAHEDAAIEYFRAEWEDEGAVLFAYEAGKEILSDGVQVFVE